MIGYIGLTLLIIAYFALITRFYKYFIPIDTVASLLLTVHAVQLGDVPFTIVNGFITVVLIIKMIQKSTTL